MTDTLPRLWARTGDPAGRPQSSPRVKFRRSRASKLVVQRSTDGGQLVSSVTTARYPEDENRNRSLPFGPGYLRQKTASRCGLGLPIVRRSWNHHGRFDSSQKPLARSDAPSRAPRHYAPPRWSREGAAADFFPRQFTSASQRLAQPLASSGGRLADKVKSASPHDGWTASSTQQLKAILWSRSRRFAAATSALDELHKQYGIAQT